jgi:3-oxoacyl-[acyl-carrier protein] reductase
VWRNEYRWPIHHSTGRVSLVTGAGSSEVIGFAIARELATQGSSVAITATTNRIHQRAEELRALGAVVYSFAADLTCTASARRLVASVTSELDPLEIVVNNAGMAQTGMEIAAAPVHQMASGDWDSHLAITLTTAFNVSREVAAGLIAGGWGRVGADRQRLERDRTTGQLSRSRRLRGREGRSRWAHQDTRARARSPRSDGQ